MRGVPEFQAEASLGRPSGRYRATAGFRPPDAAGLSMRLSPMAVIPAQGLGIDLFPPIRCCGWHPTLGRFVCITRRARPWEDCVCNHTPFGPAISCRPRVFTTG